MNKKAITIAVILVVDIEDLQDRTKFGKYLKREGVRLLKT